MRKAKKYTMPIHMIWGLTLEQKSKKNICLPDLHIGNSSISNLFLWANPGVHEYPVKMQITPEGKIPKLQVLLQFNSSITSTLVNQASPGEAGMSLVSLTHGVGKSQKTEPSLWGLNVTAWEIWGEGPQQQQRRLVKGPKGPNPAPPHRPQPALHRTSVKATTILHHFSKLLSALSSLYYEGAALGDLYTLLEDIKNATCHCHFTSHVLLRSVSPPWAQKASRLPVSWPNNNEIKHEILGLLKFNCTITQKLTLDNRAQK